MKKLFLYMFLGLLWCNQSFALTEVDKYAYKKVYDDYYTCTVYFKFLSRGVERADNLTDKQKNFVNTMKAQSNTLDMEGRELVEFLNKETDSNITNEDIQKKVENIYVSFLDIAGRDYSKTELLNDKYLTICNDLLDNYVPRFKYWKQVYNSRLTGTSSTIDKSKLVGGEKVEEPTPITSTTDSIIDESKLVGGEYLVGGECLEGVECGNPNETYNEETCKCEKTKTRKSSKKRKNIPSDDLKGKQLYCKWSTEHYGVQFKKNNDVKVFGPDDDEWISASGKYKTKPDTIIMDVKYNGKDETFRINRKTLKDDSGALCELVSGYINLEKKLKKEFKEAMDKKKEDNKI